MSAGQPDACLAEWLDQPVERYRIDRALRPGEAITAGPTDWQAIDTAMRTVDELSRR